MSGFTVIFWEVLYGMSYSVVCMAHKELRHNRHAVSLLADHIVITPKYRGKILVGDVALAAEGIIRKTCKEMNIEVISCF